MKKIELAKKVAENMNRNRVNPRHSTEDLTKILAVKMTTRELQLIVESKGL